MAQKIVYVDDIDGTEGATAQTFSVNGDTWEIDLTDENSAKLRDALAPFIDKARKAKGASVSAAKPTAGAKRTKAENAAIKKWAEKNGHSFPERGRIPQNVVDAYNAR